MQPTKRITDRSFRYVSAADTNLRQSFARVRYRLLLEQRQREADVANAQIAALRVVK